MSRKTNSKDKINLEKGAESTNTCFISANDDSLVLSNGFTLAILDTNGKVIQEGSDVTLNVFEAMTNIVVRRFCENFTGFTEADFKHIK
ncbi:hypothetical protein PS1M3_20460 [Pseudoalteromonas sp. PS1M3]|uniref:hypothetical protein n=1 Tax=Pseudoalteromonas sp. PS1M3 TaxID=87791 RepID=UPI0019500040|nr:hypothetical protein [Pseudoalteromonas sp. PS1M3]BBW91959.1 hypothetical protein PS1M3_20460 [Pseudoalteromonas sp. PS1M3]|tara:strand:- start:125 stop:391 length:267 start_codon:yes stop_codon:yes gene_type:complete